MKKKPYESGSFGVDADTLIGGSDFYAGSVLAGTGKMIGVNDAYSGSITANTNKMIGVHDAYHGGYDRYDQSGLDALAESVKSAKADKTNAVAQLNDWTAKYNEAKSKYTYYLSDERKNYQEWKNCCRLCPSCKTRNYRQYEEAKAQRINWETVMNQRLAEVQKWQNLVNQAQQRLVNAEKEFSAYKIALEEEITKRELADAQEAMEQMRSDAQQKALDVQQSQVDAQTDPMVMSAKLKAQEKNSQTTLILAGLGVLAVIFIARSFK